MGNYDEKRILNQSIQMVVVSAYTILAVALILESIFLRWEGWIVPVIFASVCTVWFLHLRQALTDTQRLWVNAFFCVVFFFWYGSHSVTLYDMSGVILILVIAFTISGESKINTMLLATYYFTLAWDVVWITVNGYEWDFLSAWRVILHGAIVLIGGKISRIISQQWHVAMHGSDQIIAELSETSKMMDVFLANLSHELRTPVNMIIGSASISQEKTQDEEIHNTLSEIYAAGVRIKYPIEDMLDFSEIEMGTLTLNTDVYMLSSLLNDLAVTLRSSIPQNLQLIIDVDPDVPTALRSDPTKISRILFHLIRNSLQYTRNGGVYVYISCIHQEYGVNLCIEVTDTGEGMTEEESSFITMGFYKANSGRVRSGGLGIGLSVVSGFVSILGGFLSIESSVGQGTTVRVSIPQEVSDEGKCVSLPHPERVHLARFVDFKKFSSPRVRTFFESMDANIERGLKTPFHHAESLSKLERLMEKVHLTHLIIGEYEYLENQDYMEKLAQSIVVGVIASEPIAFPPSSRVRVLEKPFFCFPLLGLLSLEPDAPVVENKIFFCRGVHALVVDDEPMNIKVASNILRRHGMTVDKADSGEEAVQICNKQAFDLIFMDHMMPGMDGVDAMKRIRESSFWRDHQCPILVLTANTLSAAREMFDREGFDGFIAKPIDNVELERVLRHVLPPSFITYEVPEESRPVQKPLPKTEKSAPAVQSLPAQNGNKLTVVGQPSATVPASSVPQPSTPVAAPAATSAVSQTASATVSVSLPQDETDDKWKPLTSNGIDVHLGLQYAQNDEEFYTSILQDYAKDAAEKRKKMETFRESGDCANYAILVHALKSTSLMIGAADLSAKAKALEAAAKSEDKAFIDANHQETMEQYAAVANAIFAMSPGGVPQPSASGESEELLEFSPNDDVMEFSPDGEVLDFSPNDDLFEFLPEEG